MNIEELAFKDRKILANLNAIDLLDIIEFLQEDRNQWINQFTKTHNEGVEIQKENQDLKSQLAGTTHCFDEEEHNKLKEEITNLSKDVDMWNAKYNDMFDENRMLKKQLEECQLQNFDLREDIMIQKQAIPNKLIKDKTFYDLYDMPTYEDLLTQQKEFIKWLEDYINLFDKKDIYEEGSCDMLEEILQKYRSIIGGNKDENNKQ